MGEYRSESLMMDGGMTDMSVRKLLGQKVAKLRKEAGYKSQGELADEIGVDRSMISQIETGRRGIPERRRPDLADALEVDEYELTAESLGDGAREGHVHSPESLTRWRNRVLFDRELSSDVKLILSSLPADEFLQEGWIVMVTIEQFVRVTGQPRERVERYWSNMLGSGYVERIGEPEWVLRLTFPED